MLTIYRRHQAPCKHSSRRFRNCKCPIWVQGSLRGEHVRRSLDLRSWKGASVAAIEGRASFVVSGDPDLLIKEHQGVRIVNPRAFLELL